MNNQEIFLECVKNCDDALDEATTAIIQSTVINPMYPSILVTPLQSHADKAHEAKIEQAFQNEKAQKFMASLQRQQQQNTVAASASKEKKMTVLAKRQRALKEARDDDVARSVLRSKNPSPPIKAHSSLMVHPASLSRYDLLNNIIPQSDNIMIADKQNGVRCWMLFVKCSYDVSNLMNSHQSSSNSQFKQTLAHPSYVTTKTTQAFGMHYSCNDIITDDINRDDNDINMDIDSSGSTEMVDEPSKQNIVIVINRSGSMWCLSDVEAPDNIFNGTLLDGELLMVEQEEEDSTTNILPSIGYDPFSPPIAAVKESVKKLHFVAFDLISLCGITECVSNSSWHSRQDAIRLVLPSISFGEEFITMQSKQWSTLKDFFTVKYPTVSSFKDALNANHTQTDGLILQSDTSTAYNTMTGAGRRYKPNNRKRSEWLQSRRRVGGSAKNVNAIECDVRKFKTRHTLDFWVIGKCFKCSDCSDRSCRKVSLSLATHDQMNRIDHGTENNNCLEVYSECTWRIQETVSSSLYTLSWKSDSEDHILHLDWHLMIKDDAFLGLWFKDVQSNLLNTTNERATSIDQTENFNVIVEFELLNPPHSSSLHGASKYAKYERYLYPSIMRRDKPTANSTSTVCSTMEDAVDCNADFFYHTMADHFKSVY